MFGLRRFLLKPKYLKCYSQSSNLRQVQELVKNVNPFPNVQITSSCPTEVRPLDPFMHSNSDQLRICLFSNSNNTHKNIFLETDGENIEIVDENKTDATTEMKLVVEVPIKSNLKMSTEENAIVQDLQSDKIKINSCKDIITRNLRGVSIALSSEEGNITCNGIILARNININTRGKGRISLDKIQGYLMNCSSNEGAISAKSCYADESKFVTGSGSLNLNNVHKQCTVYVLKEGNVNMTGIHGKLLLKTNGGNLNLQFSEVVDDTIILTNDSNKVVINISEEVEKNCLIELNSDKIILNDSAAHLKDCLKNNIFRLGDQECKNKLLACVQGELIFGKLSWIESLRSSVGVKGLQSE